MNDNFVVISGISGRFPESSNLKEFEENLFNGVDMVTDSGQQWPKGIFGMSNRMGRLKDPDRFDYQFFGLLNEELVEYLHPQAKILLETTYEAIIDAGINPQSLSGSRTGVYTGNSIFALDQINQRTDDSRLTTHLKILTENLPAELANRISYQFNFKGPSIFIETQCSSSSTAFTIAFNDLLLDNIDNAIVCGCQVHLEPFTYQMQQEVGFCSKRGISAVMDESADGYIKSECVASILLQKRPNAKRVYARVVSARLNDDGRKSDGMFFPSSKAQEELMIDTYKRAGVDPLDLTYFEAHGTGTKIGDYQEAKAIYNAYCAAPDRKESLPLGLLKSNIGHTEGASGVASIIKAILCFENQSLPKNLNLKHIKEEIKQFCPPLHPNIERLQYKPGMAAINNFGVGGTNSHILLEPNYKLSSDEKQEIIENIPRIVNICGRTEDAVKHVFDFIENNPDKVTRHFLALLADTMKVETDIKTDGFPFRGTLIMEKVNENISGIKYKYTKQMSQINTKSKRELWFLFPGLGGQWPAMAKALMPIRIFADKIEECRQLLSEFNVDLKILLFSEDEKETRTVGAKFCATTALQIALFEVLKELDITPDGIIGHSFGEIACAYADGCLTTKQAMVAAHSRGFITENDKQIPRGLMALCGLSKEAALRLIPSEVTVACHNGKETVVLSGLENQMKTIISDLKNNYIFCHQLEYDIPLHSKYMLSSAQPMADMIAEYVPNPKMRSKKWISTALTDEETNEEFNFASGQYFAKNLVGRVHFYDKLKHLPSNAIVVEISPHSVFKNVISQTLESSTYINLLSKNANDKNLINFLSAITKLYEVGVNPSIEKLYPSVNWPVCRGTPSISSLMVWDHHKSIPTMKYPEYFNKDTASDLISKIDLKTIDSYLLGHCVDQDNLFPASGYLVLACHQLAQSVCKSWTEVPVVFENVQFIRPVYLSANSNTTLKVRYSQITNDFVIFENENIVTKGKMLYKPENTLSLQSVLFEKQNNIIKNELSLTKEDIYTDLRAKGYHLNGQFRGLNEIRTNFQEFFGTTQWNGKMIAFLDTLLQTVQLANASRQKMAPLLFKNVRIDPRVLFKCITQNRVCQQKSNQDQLFNGSEEEFNQLEDSDEIKRFCKFSSNINFYFNPKTKIIVAPGVEFENHTHDLIPNEIKQDAPNLVLDYYEFVANDEIIKNKQFLKSLTDIVSENNYKNNLIVTEINMNSQIMIDHVKSYMANFKSWLTNIDYNLVVKKVDQNNQRLCKNILVWNHTKEQINVTRSDLVILNDTQELHDINCATLFTDLFDSIKNKGFLLIVYRYEETELQLISDFNSKQYLNVESRVENVLEVCQRLGLTLICHKYDSIGTISLLFRKNITKIGLLDNQTIEITNDRNYVWFEKLKHKFNSNNKSEVKSNIWLIARDNQINGILGLINSLRLEPGGDNVRCIVDYDNTIELPIDWNLKPFNDILSKDLVINVLKDGNLGTYRHLKLPEDYDKTESDEYFLDLGQTKEKSSIRWFDGNSVVENNDYFDFNGKKSTLVNVQIYSGGFNYNDFGGILPRAISKFSNNGNVYEFTGRRADTNQRVMGFGINCFSTSINVSENMITSIPDNWSMEEGVTILINYLTVWYSLIERCGLQRGESVLIHSGSDGVGQSAINVCKYFECDIFVTVVSDEKKSLFINEYNIPENRIFNSSDNQIRHSIIGMTNGKGVNIVLNFSGCPSPNGCSECLAENGRLFELGKMNLAYNSGMTSIRTDISIIRVDVYSCLMSSPQFITKFFDWMQRNATNGCIKPINKIVFNANEVEKVLRFGTNDKHIEKVVIRMRNEENDKGPVKTLPALKMKVSTKAYFNPNKVFIITGGLGGIGLELIQWMISLGAKKFVLTSRSGFKNSYQRFIVNRLIHFGEQNKVNIQISQNDCFTIESTRRVISQAMDLGEIGGVFHLTLILNDSLLENMEFEKFCETIDTKYMVFNNLDLEFRRLDYNLELFVVFSTTTSGKGRPGQTNYGMGNALCERICEQRRRDGLHGLAIQFGVIGDVGAIADNRELLGLIDFEDQSIRWCLDVLGRLLSVRQPIVTSYLTSSQEKQSLDEENTTIFHDFWKSIGVDPHKTPDHLTLGDIGMDSMLGLKLHQEFYYDHSINVSVQQIKIISIRMMREFESGNQEYLRQYVQDLKHFQQTVTKCEYKWPVENYVRLNNVMEGNPIYFLAPFEITFSAYKQLAERMGRPVIGLNWTKNMNSFESLRDIINYYSKILHKLSPNGGYDLLGSFDGVFIILNLINKGLVNNAVAIDLLPHYPSLEEIKSDGYLFEFIFGFVSSDCPDFYKEKLAQIGNKEQEIKPRIRSFVQGIKDKVGRQLVATDMEEMLQCAVNRIKLMTLHQAQLKTELNSSEISQKYLSEQIDCRLSIIKPISLNTKKDVNKVIEDLRQNLLLQEYDIPEESLTIDVMDIKNPFDITSENIANKIIDLFN